MAKKGQCFNSYNENLKEEIVNAYFNNQGGVKLLGKKYGISYQTITNWVQKRKKGIDLKDKHYLKGRRKDVQGSDQGFQYTSFEYKVICESNHIQISMSRKGTPLDDSPMESFHSIFKKETLYNNHITSLQEYIILVEDWI